MPGSGRRPPRRRPRGRPGSGRCSRPARRSRRPRRSRSGPAVERLQVGLDLRHRLAAVELLLHPDGQGVADEELRALADDAAAVVAAVPGFVEGHLDPLGDITVDGVRTRRLVLVELCHPVVVQVARSARGCNPPATPCCCRPCGRASGSGCGADRRSAIGVPSEGKAQASASVLSQNAECRLLPNWASTTKMRSVPVCETFANRPLPSFTTFLPTATSPLSCFSSAAARSTSYFARHFGTRLSDGVVADS